MIDRTVISDAIYLLLIVVIVRDAFVIAVGSVRTRSDENANPNNFLWQVGNNGYKVPAPP